VWEEKAFRRAKETTPEEVSRAERGLNPTR
jgi:hypothetical protein